GAGTPPPPPPPTQQMLSTQLLLLTNPGLPYQRKIVYGVKEPAPSDDYVVDNPIVAGATFAMVVDATAQCFHMPAAGWGFSNGGFRYRDPHGAYGPVKLALIHRTLRGALVAKIPITGFGGPIDLVPTNPVTQASTNLHFGATDYCGSTAGGTLGPNDARSFKAKNAPAPPGCYVNSCSPSGAFLDGDGL